MDAANVPQSVVDEPDTGFLCTSCRQRIADKTDSDGNPICYKCLLGLFTVRYVGNRIARNDKCPCGSGKKFKYCHRKDTGVLTCQ